MNRQTVSDGSYFDGDKAIVYTESHTWDPERSGYVSSATGDAQHHEVLALTATGSWVRRRWVEGKSHESVWMPQTNEQAYGWLAENGHQDAIPTTDDGTFDPVAPVSMFSTRLPTQLLAQFRKVVSVSVVGEEQRGMTVQEATEEAINAWLSLQGSAISS